MRSLWIGTLAAALSCSTPGWSQMLQPDRWIMVREEGKPAVKCRVVSTSKQKDGSTLCQAKTEAGEAITLLEEPVKGMPSGTMRMRVLATARDCKPCAPAKGATLAAAGDCKPCAPAQGATPPAAEAGPKNAPPVLPADIQGKSEPNKESTSLMGRLFRPAPGKTGAAAAGPKEVVKAASETRPQLPTATPGKEDPLSRPEIYSKNPTPAPASPPRPTVIGRIFDRGATPAVTTSVVTTPATAVPAQAGSTLAAPVVTQTREVEPSLLDRLRAQVVTSPAKPAAAPAPRRNFPSGYGSVVAARDRAILGQSVGGAMVRTPTGEMQYVPPDQMPHGPNVVPVNASNAFTLAMPGYAPGMPGGMPMMAMQQPQPVYDRGVPEGAANAFTVASTSRPVPADFGPPPQYPNAFMMDGMGGAYTRPMALAYDPRMGYVPVGGGYPQQQMLPMPHPAGQMLATLHGSLMPSERERAVVMLSQCGGHAQPEAVAAIVNAARSDPAPSVRVCCVQALARMKIASMPVYETLKELEHDRDVRVRQEAEQTLATMTKH